MAVEKSKSRGPFWSYQLNSTANSAHFAECRIFILCEIHCYLCPPKNWHDNSFLGSVATGTQRRPYLSRKRGFLILPLSRDKGTPGNQDKEFFFVPGKRDRGTRNFFCPGTMGCPVLDCLVPWKPYYIQCDRGQNESLKKLHRGQMIIKN